MNEIGRFAPAGPENTALLECTLDLGYPVRQFDIPEGLELVYNERGRVIEEAMATIAQRHEAYSRIAAQLDIDIPRLNSWDPKGAELEALKNEQRESRIRLQMLDGMDAFIDNGKLMRRLLPQQRDAMYATQHFLEFATRMRSDGREVSGKSGYIDVPTGMGKTGMLVSVAQALKMKESSDDPLRVLVLVPTQQILRQTISDKQLRPKDRKGFAKFAPHLNPSAYYQHDHTLSDLTVMTNASFNQLVQSGQMPHFDAVLIDETHTGLGENISDSIRTYYEDKVTIGFSATPDYHEDKMTAHLLDHEIFQIPLPEGIKTGRLAPVEAHHRELTLHFDESKLPEDPMERRAAILYAYTMARYRRSLKDIKDAIIKGDGVLVRCPPGGDIAYAKLIAKKLREEEWVTTNDRSYSGPIRAVAVGGSDQKAGDLDILINGFNDNNNKVQVIVYVDVINMGADLPPAKLFVDLWPMGARVKVVQGIGRVLRLVFETGPDGKAQPRWAKVITYNDPYLKDQYTCRDALALKPGQSRLSKESEYVPRYEQRSLSFTEIQTTEVASGTIGSTALQHNADVQYEVMGEEMLSLDDACERFGLDPQIAAYYFREFGFGENDELPESEFEAFAELIADAGALHEKQPEQTAQQTTGASAELPPAHTDLSVVAEQWNWRGSMTELRRQLRENGIPIAHTKINGKTRYFIADEYL